MAAAAGRPVFAAPEAAGSYVLVFYGVTPDTPPDTLTSALSPLLQEGLPITVAVDPTAFLTHRSGVFPGVRALLEIPRELLDIAPLITTFPRDEPYFQGRAGYDARRRFSTLLTAQGAHPSRVEATTTLVYAPEPVWTRDGIQTPAPMISAPGLRAAGFRTVLQLYKASLPHDESLTKNGVLTLWGGPRLSTDPQRSVRLMVESSASKRFSGEISFYFNKVSKTSPWAGLEKEAPQSKNRSISLAPSDSLRPRGFPVDLSEAVVDTASMHRRNSAAFSRLISVTILRAAAPPSAAREARVTDLASRLAGIGIASSFVERSSAASPAALRLSAPASCLPLELPLDGGDAGIDADGICKLGVVRRIGAGTDPASLTSLLAGARDMVIAIDEDAFDDPAFADALLSALVQMRLANGPRFATLDSFAQTVLAEDATVRLAAQSRNGLDRSRAQPGQSEKRDMLMADAQLAWRYIDRFTVRRTGLCLPTAQVQNGYISTYDRLAMWDVGSQLQGIRAAHRLGLIDRGAFVARVKRLIEHLPRSRIAGRLLPSGLVRATDGRAMLRAFYPSDIGRLLSALALLRQENELRDTVDKAFGRWQLADMVKDGRLLEVDGGHESEFFQSQGAHYAVRAFAEFGIHAASPYPDRALDSEADWKMHLLYAAGRIGPLGPEPLLQEGIEMGFTPSSAYLAEVLFGAQLRSHEATGKIVCPSESPIDRSPWFLYEGLRISDDGPRWSLQSDEEAAKNRPGKAESVPLLASTKAAYMWAAVHPHPYSSKMLAFVRDRARVPDAGFASGVFIETGKQTEGYVDLNTNGVILSAIDRMLTQGGTISLN